MKRWLMLMLLLVGSSGCGSMEHLLYDDDPYSYWSSPTVSSEPTCSNGGGIVQAGGVSVSQTQEPELLRK